MSTGYPLNDAINDINNQRYTFNGIDEFNIITTFDEMDMTYEYCIRRNIHAVESKLNMIIAKNPQLIYSLNGSHHHPLNRKNSHLANITNDYDNI